jgi:hypothetical protein
VCFLYEYSRIIKKEIKKDVGLCWELGCNGVNLREERRGEC